MAIFLNIFIKVFALIFSITLSVFLAVMFFSFVDNEKIEDFSYISGSKDSLNTIAVIEMDGLILQKNNDIYEITNPMIISPSKVKNYFEYLKDISPKVIIFSINSPGGTVSASKNLYDIIKNFKKNNELDILFHTNELLASGGYWVALSGDKIYANYGSIIGSIGVKGPDWFYYDEPKSISTGFFGNKIETKKGIKVYSNTAGKFKDILNPFKKPSQEELLHLQSMVNETYNDFVRIVSKERSIEENTIIDEIGALIYTSKNAEKIHLVDNITSLDDLIIKVVKDKKFLDYKIIKTNFNDRSFLLSFLTNKLPKINVNINQSCLNLRTSISVILSYQSVGC